MGILIRGKRARVLKLYWDPQDLEYSCSCLTHVSGYKAHEAPSRIQGFGPDHFCNLNNKWVIGAPFWLVRVYHVEQKGVCLNRMVLCRDGTPIEWAGFRGRMRKGEVKPS